MSESRRTAMDSRGLRPRVARLLARLRGRGSDALLLEILDRRGGLLPDGRDRWPPAPELEPPGAEA